MSTQASTPRPISQATLGPYERYAIGLLLLIYTLNFLDRQIVNILAEPIKEDLGLADWQLGLMTGLAFAVFYTVLGIPLARWADRPTTNRSNLITLSLTVWSAMTMVCGLATNFAGLLAARVGVGIGEAGCSPAAHSLISDLVPKEKRGGALGVYSMGIPLGKLLGMVTGGLIAEAYGWRAAFLIVGSPGLAVAVLARFTLRDPRSERSRAEPISARQSSPFAAIGRSRTFWLATFGCAFTSFLSYGQLAFLGSFFIRVHGWSVGQTGLWLGLGLGLAGALGTWLGGRASDAGGARDPRAYMLIPAAAGLVGALVYGAGVLLPTALLALPVLIVATALNSVWYGPGFATVQNLFPPANRATAAAVHLFIVNLIGLGTGPLVFGVLSDLLNNGFTLAGVTLEGFGPEEELRLALAAGPLAAVVATIFFLLAAKHIKRDLAAAERD